MTRILRKLRRHYRPVVILVSAVAAAVVALSARGQFGLLDGLFYDLALTVDPFRPGSSDETVIVVALDRKSLDSDLLNAIPEVFMGPQWAELILGLLPLDVRAIGFDLVFAYSPERFGALRPGFDQPFLEALADHRDQVVLARGTTELPASPYIGAVFRADHDTGDAPLALGDIDVTPDADGIVRLMQTALSVDGTDLPTFAARVIETAHGPSAPPNLLLAPRHALEHTPTYSLLDVLTCLQAQSPTATAALRQAFAGRIVLIGTTSTAQDRYFGPDRFLGRTKSEPGPVGNGCALERPEPSDPYHDTIPGVYLHAAAINAVITGSIVRQMPVFLKVTASGFAAAAGALSGATLAPWLSIVVAVAGIGVLFLLSAAFLATGFWLPIAIPSTSLVVGLIFSYGARIVVDDLRRRRLQENFGRYLAPSIVERLVANDEDPQLGSETRDVTVMFADLSGFTALSGLVSPEQLIEVTNKYLSLIAREVDAKGGYIDKFIGDSVMAMWGAPLGDPHHATHAIEAALRIVDVVLAERKADQERSQYGYAVKIGVNSGPAVVGNIGTNNRFNFTAIGETVNIAARLESVPDDYGCRLVTGSLTAALVGSDFVSCEVDWIKVKGRREAIAVYEVVTRAAAADGAAAQTYCDAYSDALKRYRAGRFIEAREIWQAIRHPALGASGPAKVMADRCADLTASPIAHWDGVWVKTSK